MTAGKCTLNVPTNSNSSRTYSTVPKQPADPHLYQLWTCRLSASPHHHETPSPFFTIRPSSPQSSLRCINPSLLPPACWDLGTRYQHPVIEISHVFFFQSLFAIRKTHRRLREEVPGGGDWTASAACRRHARLENKGDKDKACAIRAEQLLLCMYPASQYRKEKTSEIGRGQIES